MQPECLIINRSRHTHKDDMQIQRNTETEAGNCRVDESQLVESSVW